MHIERSDVSILITPQIRLDNVSVTYTKEKKPFVAISDINLVVNRGEFIFVTGSSGAGKSTLLHVIAGATRPSKGGVYLAGSNAKFMSARTKEKKNIKIGFVPQMSHLTRRNTIEQNLQPFAQMTRSKQYSNAQRMDKALDLVDLKGVKDRYPAELSLGESRRVELARALLANPSILVLDEITANLDHDTAWDLFHLLMELNMYGITIVMATHAKKLVDIYRKRVLTLVNGQIVSDVNKGKYGYIK